MVNVFVNGHSPPDKRVQPKRKVASPHDQLPPPALPINGVEYGVGEFLGIIQLYQRKSIAGWHDKEDDVSTIQLFEAVAKGCVQCYP